MKLDCGLTPCISLACRLITYGIDCVMSACSVYTTWHHYISARALPASQRRTRTSTSPLWFCPSWWARSASVSGFQLTTYGECSFVCVAAAAWNGRVMKPQKLIMKAQNKMNEWMNLYLPWTTTQENKKAVLPQGNRAMPQVFFSVEVRQQHSLQV